MNENDKETLKHFGIIMLAALAGGILGALIVMSHHSFKAQKHIHIYAPPMLINRAERDFTNLEKDFDKFTKKLLKRLKHPEFDEEYIEEDYIIIPKKTIENLSGKNNNLEPFRGPRPPKTREN